MDKPFETIVESIPNQKKGLEFLGKLYDVANPKAVFCDPIEIQRKSLGKNTVFGWW